MPGQCHSGHARSVPFSSGHASSVPFSSGHARSVPFSSVKLKLHVFTTFFTCRISMHGRQRCLIELSCALPGCWERLSLHYFHRSITHKPRGLAFTVVQDDFVFGTMGQGQCESAIKLRDDLGVYVLTGVWEFPSDGLVETYCAVLFFKLSGLPPVQSQSMRVLEKVLRMSQDFRFASEIR